jgi:hypothetical protein
MNRQMPNHGTAALVLGAALLCQLVTQAAELTNGMPTPPGLVSWWRGEGTARDSIGRADGVLYHGVKFAAGKTGQCFAFDGVSSGINVPDVPALALTNSLTIECWLFVNRAPTAPGMIIFRGDTRSGFDPYYVSLEPEQGTSGMLGFVVWGADDLNASINAPMPLGSWTHIAATLDDCSGIMRLYTNAVVAAETKTAVRPLDALDPDFQPGVGIGNHSSQPGRFNYPFRGLIDELRVYNRALSATEIQAIYTSGLASAPPPH